jgi:hypothetical protein
MLRGALVLALAAVTGCMPQSGGPSPRAVLEVSSIDYPLSRIVQQVESVHSLGPRVDKSAEIIEVGGRKVPQFSQYEIAYWYPQSASDIYGVALVKWVSDLNGPDAKTIRDRYFIEVYSQDESCSLCDSIKRALSEQRVSYFSACDSPNRTAYEKSRCGT